MELFQRRIVAGQFRRQHLREFRNKIEPPIETRLQPERAGREQTFRVYKNEHQIFKEEKSEELLPFKLERQAERWTI